VFENSKKIAFWEFVFGQKFYIYLEIFPSDFSY